MYIKISPPQNDSGVVRLPNPPKYTTKGDIYIFKNIPIFKFIFYI